MFCDNWGQMMYEIDPPIHVNTPHGERLFYWRDVVLMISMETQKFFTCPVCVKEVLRN